MLSSTLRNSFRIRQCSSTNICRSVSSCRNRKDELSEMLHLLKNAPPNDFSLGQNFKITVKHINSTFPKCISNDTTVMRGAYFNYDDFSDHQYFFHLLDLPAEFRNFARANVFDAFLYRFLKPPA